MVKLSSIFNTVYYVEHWAKDLVYLFECADKQLHSMETLHFASPYTKFNEVIQQWRNDGCIQLDIAGCKFTPSSMQVLMTHIGEPTFILVDSVDAFRNSLIQISVKRTQEKITEVELPVYNREKYLTDISQYVQTLSSRQNYVLGNLDIEIMQPLAIMLALRVPELHIDFGRHTADIFREMHFNIPLYENTYGEYYALYGDTFFYTKFKGNEDSILGSDAMSFDNFKRNFIPIPAIVGKEDVTNNPDFHKLLQTQKVKFTNEVNKRRKTLYDYFK